MSTYYIGVVAFKEGFFAGMTTTYNASMSHNKESEIQLIDG